MYKLDVDRAKRLEDFHWAYCESKLVRRINKKLKMQLVSTEKQFYEDLLDNNNKLLKQFVCGSPNTIKQLYREIIVGGIGAAIEQEIVEAERAIHNIRNDQSKDEQTKTGEIKEVKLRPNAIKTRLDQIFNYTDFCRKKSNDEDISELDKVTAENWSAYQLTYHLGTHICCYCNRQYTNTLNVGKKGYARPQLDHFYPKSIYPYFALSLYNLIPSCATCNGTFKKDENPLDADGKDIWLHPYQQQIDENIKFMRKDISNDHSLLSKSYQKTKPDQFEITLFDPGSCPQSTKSLELFKLEQMYNLHKSEVADRINLIAAYSDKAIASALENMSGNSTVPEEPRVQELVSIVRHGFNKQFLSQQPDKVILGKLLGDIMTNEFDH